MAGNMRTESGTARRLLAFAGSFSLVVGLIGLLIPVFPTSPFVVLAAYCYLRSSDRLYHWLINHRYLGRYVRDYVHQRGMRRRAKVVALATLLVSLSVSGYFINNLYARLFLLVFGAVYTVYLLRLRTLPDKPLKSMVKVRTGSSQRAANDS